MQSISVVIPVYNAEKYLAEAVASALAQPETSEVVLVEDGSPDGSLGLCSRLESEHDVVRLVRHPGGANLGAGATRNLGIAATSHGLIAFLDADDFYLPGRFSEAIRILRAAPEIDGVYEAVGTHCEKLADAGEYPMVAGTGLTTLVKHVAPDALFEAMFKDGLGGLHLDGLLVRRRAFGKAGLFDPHLMIAQDTALLIRLGIKAQLVPGRLGEAVAMRRIHAHNRIPSDPARADRFRAEMWRTVFRWGCRHGVTDERLDIMLRNYLVLSEAHRFGHRAWRIRKLLGALRLVPLACTTPRSMQLGIFRHYRRRCLRAAFGRGEEDVSV